MEADLQRYYSIDYRDRWRGGLTLRRLWVLITHLPPDSACWRASRNSEPHWSLEAHLLDDLRVALTSSKRKPAKPHPSRPKPRPKQSKGLKRRIADAKRRRAARLHDPEG